jgi:hypothetical protein
MFVKVVPKSIKITVQDENLIIHGYDENKLQIENYNDFILGSLIRRLNFPMNKKSQC